MGKLKILHAASFRHKRLSLRWLFAKVIITVSVFISFINLSVVNQTYMSRGFVDTIKKSKDNMSAKAIDIGGQALVLDNLKQSVLKNPNVQKLVIQDDLNIFPPNDTREQSNSSSEIPEIYLHSGRFDILIKMVYAYFYSVMKFIPEPIQMAYTEHLRVWNKFHESCSYSDKRWFDATIPCRRKKNVTDFISAFQNTIESIEKYGFISNTSRIPLSNSGFVLNGAHRLASSVISRRNATFQHMDYDRRYGWNYNFFKQRGLSSKWTRLMMLEWMRIQVLLPNLKRKVSIISIISNNSKKYKMMRKTVKEVCSVDKGILYEHEVNITKLGMAQLIIHMYRNQDRQDVKIFERISKFTSETIKILLLFFYGKNTNELMRCQYEVRKLYNDSFFNSTAHILDTPEENLILAQMTLNPNSVHFLNFAKNGLKCQAIAKELTLRSSLKSVDTLPDMQIGRDDAMIDSDSVLDLYILRRRTDVDILFRNAIDVTILGSRNGSGIHMVAHAFQSNATYPERAWAEDHFSKRVKTKWDLFYDPDNYGFCYGIKFVSLIQLLEYKLKRNEPAKDQWDVALILKLLKNK